MATTDPNSFHDPDLKALICRAWGTEAAPVALRERIEAMGIGAGRARAAEITPAPALPASGWPWVLRHPRPLYGLAAAVTMVIGFAVAYQLDQPPAWKSTSGAYVVSSPTAPAPPPSTLPSALPVNLFERLADAHERCAGYPDHDGFKGVARDDFGAVRQRLQNELGFSVLAGPLENGKGDWTFRGAAVCPVGQIAAAHLMFARKRQAVSVFSLPRAACPQARTGDVFESEDPDHPVAVFVRPGGVQCVVGSSPDGSLSSADLHRIGEGLIRE